MRTLTLLAFLLLSPTVPAQLELPAIFGDGMVLQRDTQAAVWGRAAPRQAVAVLGSWMDGPVRTSADAQGRWRVDVPTPVAGGPHRLEVEAGPRVVFEDVWVGEVWLASGQSNMEWPLSATEGGDADIAAADHPRLRFFDVANVTAQEPASDCTGSWRVARPTEVASFSAVAYHFGLQLLGELDVPIGLIGTNWGGTPAKAWTSERALQVRGDFAPDLERLRGARSATRDETPLEVRQIEWWGRQEATDPGMREGWMESAWKDGDWARITVPGAFSDVDLGDFDGCVWFRRSIELPADWAGPELDLQLGAIDDMDLVWFNGELVGETRDMVRSGAAREYALPAGLARTGSNVVTVCVVDTGGAGRLGSPDQAMRLSLRTSSEAESIDLTGEWRARPGASLADLGEWPRDDWFGPTFSTALFNGMIAPLVPFAMRGAIWYQGESDVGRAHVYRSLFPGMIADWRAHWGRGDFPFLFVQIAPFDYGGDPDAAALLREAQAGALAAPNTGMAVTMDIGDPGDIHPRNKREVGRRLALWALARTYGRDDVVYSGPLYRSSQAQGDHMRILFDHAAGLATSGGAPSCLTIAGADRVFHPAVATIEGEALLVHADGVSAPVAVRYAWGAADTPNLLNGAGLPMASFRTDNWER